MIPYKKVLKKKKKGVCKLKKSAKFCPEGGEIVYCLLPKQEYSIQPNPLLAIRFLCFYIALSRARCLALWERLPCQAENDNSR